MPQRLPPPLTELLSAVSQPAALVDPRGQISWSNPSFRQLFAPGRVPGSLAEWEAGSPPGTGPLWDDLRRGGSSVRRLSSSGGIGTFRLTLVPGPSGDSVLICSSSPGHRGLAELRERTGVLETIFHSLNEGVLAVDAQERILAMSRSAERITGFAEAEVLGRVWHEVLQAPDAAQSPFQTLIHGGQGFYQKEMTMGGKGGRPVHVAVNAAAVKTPDGAVEGAVVVVRDLTEVDRVREQVRDASQTHGIVGNHPLIRRLVDTVETVAPSDAPILIVGESGTGKELVAKAVHRLSPRRESPFVKVNCVALADDLLESELFGRAQGALTGAARERPGRWESAEGGTLFLDEVDGTSPALQLKLLRALQEGTFQRVGESESRRSDVRIVAATEKDLREEMAEGRFREDLFLLLGAVSLEIAPLRDRREDVPLLVDHFLKRLASREGRRKIVAPSVYPVLQRYRWPRNVRELEDALVHAYVCSAGDVINVDALPDHVRRGESPLEEEAATRAEQRAIYAALDATGWNKGEAARRLGMSRTTLWRRMRDLGIHETHRSHRL